MFLRCYLPEEELKNGDLEDYCERKINRRLHVMFKDMEKGREEKQGDIRGGEIEKMGDPYADSGLVHEFASSDRKS